MRPAKGKGSTVGQWRGPGSLKMGAFLLAYCGNRRSVRPLFLFRCILSAPTPADGRTDLLGDEGGGRGEYRQVSFVHP